MNSIIEVEHIGNDVLQLPIKVIKNSNPLWLKPESGGLWTSPINSSCSWRKWCENENWKTNLLSHSFHIHIRTDCLCTIDSYDTLIKKLVHTGIMKPRSIDFEKLSNLYDGIWLTKNGLLETSFPGEYTMYSWDCETILLFSSNPIVDLKSK